MPLVQTAQDERGKERGDDERAAREAAAARRLGVRISVSASGIEVRKDGDSVGGSTRSARARPRRSGEMPKSPFVVAFIADKRDVKEYSTPEREIGTA